MSTTKHSFRCLLNLEDFLVELALLGAERLRHGMVQRLVIVVGQRGAKEGLRFVRRVIHHLHPTVFLGIVHFHDRVGEWLIGCSD